MTKSVLNWISGTTNEISPSKSGESINPVSKLWIHYDYGISVIDCIFTKTR